VLEERGMEQLVRALSSAIEGAVVVLDRRGETMAASDFRRQLPQGAIDDIQRQIENRDAAGQAVAFAPEHAELAGRALALPVGAAGRDRPQAWVVAVSDSGALREFERLLLQQAVTVVALELMRRRVMLETERRLAGDLLEEAFSGDLEGRELATRLRPFGVDGDAAVLLFAVSEAKAAQPILERTLTDAGVGAVVAAQEGRLCAVADAAAMEPVVLAEKARQALGEQFTGVRAAVSRPGPVSSLRRCFQEARCALELSALSNGTDGGANEGVASYRDLGAFQFLLSLHDDDALRVYCDGVLGPLEDGENGYGGELLRSLEAFLEHNGHWEKAARQLYCHRHTLRYRIRRVEELTGRDLSRARDRIEFWLALRARELVR
jgi:purine catabolism regulator